MARAHVYRPITDEAGNLLTGSTVTVLDVNGDPIAQPLYSGPAGSTTLPNPFVASSGKIDLWLASPQRLQFSITPPGRPTFGVAVDGHPSGDEALYSPAGRVVITNQGTIGDTLQMITPPDKVTGILGEARWQAPGASSGLTPLEVLADWTLLDAEMPGDFVFGAYAGLISDATSTPVPDGTIVPATVAGSTLTHALLLPLPTDSGIADPGNVWEYSSYVEVDLTPMTPGSSPPFGMVQDGWIEFYVRGTRTGLIAGGPDGGFTEILFQVAGPSGWYTEVVNTARYTSDTDFVPYALPLPKGATTIRILGRHSFNGDAFAAISGSRAYVAGIKITRGGRIPDHTHGDPMTQTVALGAGATNGAATGSVAVGDAASAGGNDSVAIGRSAASAGLRGVAVGTSATAPAPRAVAVGYSADGLGDDSIAVGQSSEASGAASIALGSGAQALADGAIAAGQSASASGANAIAMGAGASASGEDSAAFGANATVGVGHDRSVAFGPGAATTTADQIVLGAATHLVYVPGEFRLLGDAIVGGAASKVGFFGSVGTTKPTVTGSRGGNAALASLITALADMGLITDSTTA